MISRRHLEAMGLRLALPTDTSHMGTIFGSTLVARMEPVDRETEEKGALGER
jgi:hypothetical protein